jgi:hypothetical protein
MENKPEGTQDNVEHSDQPPTHEQSPDGSAHSHMIVVNYEKETERNRAVQAINKHTDDKAERPQGTIRYIPRETDLEELTEELATRVKPEHVHLYKIEEQEVALPESKTDWLTREYDEQMENLDNMMNFVLTNHGGRLISPIETRYEIASRKGRVEVSFETGPQNKSVEVSFDGERKAVEHLKESINESLDQIGNSASEGGDKASSHQDTTEIGGDS